MIDFFIDFYNILMCKNSVVTFFESAKLCIYEILRKKHGKNLPYFSFFYKSRLNNLYLSNPAAATILDISKSNIIEFTSL